MDNVPLPMKTEEANIETGTYKAHMEKYMESVDEILLPGKTEETNVEVDTGKFHTNEDVPVGEENPATKDIKEEENQDQKDFIDNTNTNDVRIGSSGEDEGNGSGSKPSPLTTHLPPEIEVEELIRVEDTPDRQHNR